ncbi:hypothetical protein BASA61_000075 [Batrachochytrium salamandrivorans]|nr:hypothetical protein BASA61_000075 [Batrachochytrium salamandrivorans]
MYVHSWISRKSSLPTTLCSAYTLQSTTGFNNTMKFSALVVSTLVAVTSVYALAIPDAAAPETQSLNFKRDASLVSASGHQQIYRRSPQYDG